MVLLCNLGSEYCEKAKLQERAMRSLVWVLFCIQALAHSLCLCYTIAMLGPCLSLLHGSSAQPCTLTLPCWQSFPAAAWTCPVPTGSLSSCWTVTDPGCGPWTCPLTRLGSCQGAPCLVWPPALPPRWCLWLPAHLPSRLLGTACSSRSSPLISFFPWGWPRLRSSCSPVKAEQAALRDRSLSFLQHSSWTGNLVELLEGKFSQQLWTV